jgi:hypothetical protein
MKKKVAKKTAKKKAPKKPARKAVKKIIKPKAKKPAKKAVKKTKKATPAKSKKTTPTPKPIGIVTHYYTHIKVGIIKFKSPIKVGSNIRIKGATTDFVQKIDSLQYDHKPVKVAPKGKLIGIKLKKRVREHDQVFLEK